MNHRLHSCEGENQVICPMARFAAVSPLYSGARRLFSPLRSILLVLLGIHSAIVLAQSPQIESAKTDKTSAPSSVSAAEPAIADHEQFASYWTTEPGWRTELQLRNSLASEELTVAPALRSADGTETALPAVSIKPGDVVTLDLHDVLMKVAPELIGTYGSVVLRYRAPASRALYAAVMLRVEGRPIAFHLDAALGPSDRTRGSREGIWWLRDSASDYLILTNIADRRLDAGLILYDSRGRSWRQNLSLSARQTTRLSVRTLLGQAKLSGSYGGIEINVTNGVGYLRTTHFLFDEIGGFSALLKMFYGNTGSTFAERSWGGVKEWTTRAPMLALTDPDPALGFPAGTTLQPKVLIRNTSAKTYTTHVRFTWRSAVTIGKSAPIELKFRPHETQVVDVAALQTQKLLPADAHWASVIVSAPVQPDDLMAIATSYDHSGRYGTQTPFNDQLTFHWEAGKWEVDSMHNSLVTVGNGGNKTVHAQVTIFYNQGRERYQLEQMLAPDEQMWLDFGKLIRERVTDKEGRILPPDISYGTYTVRELTDTYGGNLYEGKVILDKTNGHAAYGCAWCCGINHVKFTNDPITLPVLGTQAQQVLGQDVCDNNWYDITASFFGWGTGNSSIATANGKQIHGVAAGTTTDFASSDIVPYGHEHEPPDGCPTHAWAPQGNTNVGPYQVEPINVNSQGPVAAGDCPNSSYPGYVKYVTNQVQYLDGTAYAFSGLTAADIITIGSRHDLGSGTSTGSATTTGDGSFQDQYSVCSAACPGSSGETDASQNWTVNGVPLPHVNGVIYKCTSISIDGH
jgi:hypothetical protein